MSINLRTFHISDLPYDRIFILLKPDFHNNLFNFIKEISFLGLNSQFFSNRLYLSTFKQWKSRKHFIPLGFILDLHKSFPTEFPIELIECSIEAYKGPSSSTIIYNPNLPLIEDSRLLKLLAHAIGDGYIGGGFGSKLPKGKSHSEYRNFNTTLLDTFANDLSIFGKIKVSVNKKHGHVIIPNLIGYILQHIYKIKFKSRESEIPPILFNLPRELIASFIRALADDEGHVYDSSIEIYSTNKKLFEDFILLIKLKFPELKISKLKVNLHQKNPKYYFKILSESLEIYNQFIGFDSPDKKQDLIFAINRRKLWAQDKSRRLAKYKILYYLNEKPMTAKELSRKIGVTHTSILYFLKNLKIGGFVSKQQKIKNSYLLMRMY